jgi:hypothetical protein
MQQAGSDDEHTKLAWYKRLPGVAWDLNVVLLQILELG